MNDEVLEPVKPVGATVAPAARRKRDQVERDPNDLSGKIQLEIGKKPGQVVKARKVGHHNYRVTWLDPDFKPGDSGLVVQTYRHTESKFLSVQLGPDKQLIITDRTINSRSVG
jgi:hypothetical protein